MKPLRPYQQHSIDVLRESLRAGERPVLSAPTGSGKTKIAASIFALARARHRRVIFCVPYLSLINQTYRAFLAEGIDEREIGIIQGNHDLTDWSREVQICSVETLNRRPKLPDGDIIIFDECFHPDHELCTLSGWKKIYEINEGELVMAFDPLTGSCQFEKAERVVKNYFNGDLIQTKAAGFLTLTTPDHEQPVKYGNKLERVKIGEMQVKYNMQLPVSGHIKDGCSLTAVERLMIAYEADGTHIYTRKKDGLITYRFAFRRDRKVDRLEMILKECEIEYKKMVNARGDIVISFQSFLQLEKNFDWFDPYDSKTKNEEFLDELTKWDGWENDNGYHWEHKDDAAIDKVQIIASLCGYSASFFKVSKGRTRIRWKVKKIWRDTLASFENVKYEGYVHCVTVKSGNLLTRYNGVVCVSGNCHRNSVLYERWMLSNPDAYFIGLSATPFTRGMDKLWSRMIVVSTIEELINLGFLAKFKYFAPAQPDLSGIKTVAGDYHEGQLGERMSQAELVADIVTTWLQRAQWRPTFCFCVNRKHAKEVQDQFERAGVRCGYIDAYTPVDEREQMIEQLRIGELKVITNIGTMTTGVDAPFVSCLILARPTKSESLYIQIVGRVLRTHPEKDFALVLDHSNTALNLGLPTEIHYDSFNTGESSKAEKDKKEKEAKERKERLCPSCACVVKPGQRTCIECGYIYPARSDVEVSDGELVELGTKGKKEKATRDDKQMWFSGLLWIAKERGYKEGWAARQYRDRFGVWPRGLHEVPEYPTQTMFNFVKHKQIAFAKARDKANLKVAS